MSFPDPSAFCQKLLVDPLSQSGGLVLNLNALLSSNMAALHRPQDLVFNLKVSLYLDRTSVYGYV